MSDIYSAPADYDLEFITSFDFGEAYEFDIRAIWKHTKTHKLYTARDSGCSCPSPFEDFHNINELEDFSEHYLIEEAMEYGRQGKAVSEWIQDIRDIEKKYGRTFSFIPGSTPANS